MTYPTYGNPYPAYQPYQAFQPRTIPGRVVRTPEEIAPNEIPMDGSVSLFPAQDYSCITAKSWQADGTIATVRYVPEAQPKEDPLAPILARLDAIEQRLDKPRTRKKEADSE